jgi:hypothetical protein
MTALIIGLVVGYVASDKQEQIKNFIKKFTK